MSQLYSKEFLIEDLKVKQMDVVSVSNILSLIQNDLTVEQKKYLLLSLTEEDIMVGYYKFGLRNIYHLLPKKYKKDDRVTFIACLFGDDISSMPKKLKEDYIFNRFLLYHIVDSIKYVDLSMLKQNNNELLSIYVLSHLGSIDRVPKECLTKDMVAQYIRHLYCLGYRGDGIVLSNIPESFKEDESIISISFLANPSLLFELDVDAVSKYISKSDERFNVYYKILCKKQIELMSSSDESSNNRSDITLDDISKQKDNILRMQSLLNARSSYLKIKEKINQKKKNR